MHFSIPFLTRSKNLTVTDQSEDSGVTIDDDARTMDELLENDDNVFEELPVETRRRLLRWKLAVYFFTGVIFILLVTLVVIGIQPRSGKELEEPGDDEPVWDDDSEHIADDPRLEKYQTPSDTTFCAPWPLTAAESRSSLNLDTKTSQVSFDIPANSDLIFFISRGQPTKGHLTVTSNRMRRLETIAVNVTAEYDHRGHLEQTKACYSENDTEGGIMIWAKDIDSSLLPSFNISIELPWSSFRDFSTDLSGGAYTQSFGDFFDLWSPNGFAVVRLKGGNETIRSLGMFAESAFIQTSDAAVSANFYSSDAVHIRTTNAPIDGVVWAFGQKDEAITEVSMKTNNGHIRAALTMASDFNAVKLNASLHTTNGVLNVTMPRMPFLDPDYKFIIDASTTNAASSVFLSPDFAGTFDLRTSHNGKTQVRWDSGMRDPWGKGRKHKLDMAHYEDVHKSGKVYWGDEAPETMGDIRVKTTQENVWLYT
ncbi:hypothetical protein HHX47_DHR3000488 [Lentinula edodes]|nr:hypothetical protein HHX47_DHR3000488 [Lentinula edodes]